MTLNSYCYDNTGVSIAAGQGDDYYCYSAPIPIPANLDGAYINFVTGYASTAMWGWDINLYRNSTNALYFFWPTTPANSAGGVSTGMVYDALSAGSPIGPAQTYIVNSGTDGPAPYVNWQTTQTGKYLGVRFYNEVEGRLNYAWMQLDTGASSGFPAKVNQYCLRRSGAMILAGNTGSEMIFRNGFD